MANITVSIEAGKDGKSKILKYYGISKEDYPAVIDRLMTPALPDNPFRKPIPSKNIMKAWVKGDQICVAVSDDKIGDFLKTGLVGIMNGLKKTGHYSEDEIGQLADKTDFAEET